MRAETLARLGELGYSTYDEYLQSPLWAANKARLKLVYRCWICKTNRNLHAHHCSYDNIGNEQHGDLIVLCKNHHRSVHRLVNNGHPLLTAHIYISEGKRSPYKPTPDQLERKRKRKLVLQENNRLARLDMTKLERRIALNAFRESIGFPQHDLVTRKAIK